MKGSKPVFWHEGLFLQPHHFQLQDQFTHQLVDTVAHALNPYPWGLMEMDIHREGLLAGSFEIKKLDMLFPDCTRVTFPGNAVIAPLPLKNFAPEDGSNLPVYLGLPRWSRDRPNVSAQGSAESLNGILPVKAPARFTVQDLPESVQDLYAHQGEAEIRFLQYQLKLFAGETGDEAEDYELVQIALLEPEGDGFRLSDKFIPPALWTGASEVLQALVEEVRDRLTAKGQDLSGYKASRFTRGAAPGGQDIMLLQALQCISRHIPVWHHICESHRLHPMEVYRHLRSLVGELSTFVTGADPLGAIEDSPALPPYRHRNAGQCFHLGLTRMVSFLDALSAGPEYIIDLLFDGTYFTSDLSPGLFEGRARFYLVLESEVGRTVLNQFMATTAKVASREHMPLLIARALPGLRLHPLSEPPPALPKRSEAAYFELDTSDLEAWQHIRDGANIALYFDTPIPDLKAQLMVVYET